MHALHAVARHMFDFASLAEPVAALLSLTLLEVVLGIDNILFISLLCARLPAEQQSRARLIGLTLAMVMRIGLLYSLFIIMHLTQPWFWLFGHSGYSVMTSRAGM
jgi:predicted tellurium resistance membrane protein TerC